jgi:alkyl hydroperoxide reductase subunit AhpF
MSVINPNITHTMIDGAVFREESKDIMAVPAVFLDDKLNLHKFQNCSCLQDL